jgi:isopenicillin N synthase-like dioxygenase
MKNGSDTSSTAHEIRETCQNTGFFYVKNHGVPEELQQSIMENA